MSNDIVFARTGHRNKIEALNVVKDLMSYKLAKQYNKKARLILRLGKYIIKYNIRFTLLTKPDLLLIASLGLQLQKTLYSLYNTIAFTSNP